MSRAKKTISLLFLFLFFFFISGCSPFVGAGQPSNDFKTEILNNDSSIGQTFTSRHAGLQGVAAFLIPQRQGSGKIELQVRSFSFEVDPITSVVILLSEIDEAGYYQFTFDTQPDSYLKDYFLEFRFTGDGEVLVGTGDPKSYEDGSLYKNGSPVEKQLAFQLIYSVPHLLLGLLNQVYVWGYWIGLAILFFILPGFILINLVFPQTEPLEFWDSIGLAGPISLSLMIFLFLWFGFLGVKIGSLIPWILLLGTGSLYLWVNLRKRRNHEKRKKTPKFNLIFTLCMVMALVIISFLRFYVIRPFDYPMGSDSIQHSVMTQLFLDNQGMFSSWLPYAPYESFSVQFGFSAGAAVWSWLLGYSAPFGVFSFGQVLNILSILPIYTLGKKLSGNSVWVGLSAMILAGLFSLYPAFFVNWGRYPQLAGQMVLPAAVWFSVMVLEKRDFSLKMSIITALLFVGMVLSYYRMAFFYLSILIPLVFLWGIIHHKNRIHYWLQSIVNLGIAGIVAILLVLPWIPHLSGGSISEAAEEGAGLQSLALIIKDTGDLFIGYFHQWRWFWILSGFGLIVAAYKRFWVAFSLVLFLPFLFIFRLGSLVDIPGTYTIESVSINNFLYIPLGILSGMLIGWFIQIFQNRFSSWFWSGVGVIIFFTLFCFLGAWNQKGILKPWSHNFVTRPDQRAMKWIKNNTPPDALFLTNGFPFRDTSALAGDAGYWLPLLTGRRNTLPPQYALVFEQSVPPEYTRNSIELIHLLDQFAPDDPKIIGKICDWRVDYIYIGQKHDMYPQVLSPDEFQNVTYFRPVYQEDRVKIFEFNKVVCHK